ncbi:hypothetical protein PtB15_8B218 [Puccinia triticina]|nr:hypothetical protein PtB15_8B218 [Puccinia triticina]
MAAYRADLERSKKLTAVEKITEGAKRGRKGRRGRSSQRSAPGTSTSANSTSSTPAASQVSVLDSNPAFVLSDYENLTVWLKMAENRTNHQDFNHPEPRRYPPAWNQDGVNGGPSSMSLLVNWLVNNGNFNRWLSCGLNGPLQEERLALCSEVEQILRAHGIMMRPPRY